MHITVNIFVHPSAYSSWRFMYQFHSKIVYYFFLPIRRLISAIGDIHISTCYQHESKSNDILHFIIHNSNLFFNESILLISQITFAKGKLNG